MGKTTFIKVNVWDLNKTFECTIFVDHITHVQDTKNNQTLIFVSGKEILSTESYLSVLRKIDES